MTVTYNVPELTHPNSNITIFELAKILESEYHLLEEFSKDNEEAIAKYILKKVARGQKLNLQDINGHIQYLWREWILSGGHSIITKAAQDRGDPSFVHTSAYYLGVSVEAQFSKEDMNTLFRV